jgi:hypothetical protein
MARKNIRLDYVRSYGKDNGAVKEPRASEMPEATDKFGHGAVSGPLPG